MRDPEDLGGRIERREGADRDHYFAREYFKEDVVTRGGKAEIPEARYYVEAEFKDGVIEMDFVLRRDDLPGSEGVFRRSGQLRGRDEFRGALEYFRAKHGKAAIKGIKGDWGAGDNLVEFNRVFRDRLRGDRDGNDFQRALQEGSIGADEWNAALRSAALETPTGKWAGAEEFSNVEIQRQNGFDPNTVAFDHIVVVFHKVRSERERDRRRFRPGAADERGFAGAGGAWQAIDRRRHRRQSSARVRPTERERDRSRQPVATAARTPSAARAAARSAAPGGTRRRRRPARTRRAGPDRD